MTNYPREPRDEVEDQDALEASEPTAGAVEEPTDSEDQDTPPGSAPPEE